MGLNPELAGRSYPAAAVYEVGREKIAEFARAIGSQDPVHFDPEAARALGHPDVVAPPTFAVIVSQRAEFTLLFDPESGVDFSRLVHGEEKFTHHRPIHAGDRLSAVLTVQRARETRGIGMLSTRVLITDAEGEPVSTVDATMIIRPEDEGAQ